MPGREGRATLEQARAGNTFPNLPPRPRGWVEWGADGRFVAPMVARPPSHVLLEGVDASTVEAILCVVLVLCLNGRLLSVKGGSAAALGAALGSLANLVIALVVQQYVDGSARLGRLRGELRANRAVYASVRAPPAMKTDRRNRCAQGLPSGTNRKDICSASPH